MALLALLNAHRTAKTPGSAMSDILSISARLGLALLLSAMVDVERSFSDKPAGLRTHILVGLGAALFMTLADVGGFDMGRVAAGVITGVGFLGAGTIIRERGMVLGLTTAASIWAVAGIGIAVAMKLWVVSVMATGAVILVLWGLGYLENLVERALERRRKRGDKKP